MSPDINPNSLSVTAYVPYIPIQGAGIRLYHYAHFGVIGILGNCFYKISLFHTFFWGGGGQWSLKFYIYYIPLYAYYNL